MMIKLASQYFMLLLAYSFSTVYYNNNNNSKNNKAASTSAYVGANLLKQLPKTTEPTPTLKTTTRLILDNRFSYEFTINQQNLQNQEIYDDSASASSVSHLPYEEFSKLLEIKVQFYADFIQDFCIWKNWEIIRLFFPNNQINIYTCSYFQKFLIKVDVHVRCESYDHDKTLLLIDQKIKLGEEPSNPNPRLNSTSTTSTTSTTNNYKRNVPIIILNFLSNEVGNQISLKLIRQFSLKTSTVLMLGENFIFQNDQLHPNVNFNYKLTFASYTLNNNSTENTNSTSINKNSNISDFAYINIEDIYGFATSSEVIRHHVASWFPSKGLQIMKQVSPGLEDFHGRLLRITSAVGNPVVYLDRDPSTDQVIGARGYLPDILESVSSHLNFTYILIEPIDRGFGSIDSYGNWTGMVGQIQREEVDIAMMSFSFTASRKEIMDFSPPIEYSAARLLIRRDFQNAELKWNVFLEPFQWKIWLAIPCTVILGVLLLQCSTYFKIMDVSPIESICLLFICFLQKGVSGHSLFENLPSRIILGSFWLLAVVTYASYTAVLTSFLASTTERLPLNSLAEAVQNRNWKLGLIGGSSYQDRVKSSPRPEFQQFWARLEKDQPAFVRGFRDGIEKVFNEKYAFFTSDLVPSFMVKDNCSYSWVPGSYFPGFGYMGYQKNMPFAAPISHRVAKIRETGQMRRLFKKWWGQGSGCSGVNDGFVGMSLYETGTAFLVLLLGMSLAVSLLTGELFFGSRKHFDENAGSRQEASIPNGQSSNLKGQFTYNSDFGTNLPQFPEYSNKLWNSSTQSQILK